ncbi:MAG: VOC family protein [Cellvibrionaceae bacterium]
MNIPEGFGTVFPYIFVKDASDFSAFLVEAFGAVEELRKLRADGVIANIQIKIGTSIFMLSEASEQYPAMPSAYYIYVENANLAMKQAMISGATLEMEVTDMPYDDRQGGVRDPFGNIWWISQRLVDGPYR